MPKPAKDYLIEEWSEVFEYDETSPSGIVWKINGNNKSKGKAVGWQTENGHWKAEYKNKGVQLHRVVYHLHHLNLKPDEVIDHIDGNPSNNKIENLRMVDMAANGRNKKRAKNNTTGVGGVFESHVFVANWTVHGKQFSKKFNVKDYASIEEAKQAAIDFRFNKIGELNLLDFGYTERHGL